VFWGEKQPGKDNFGGGKREFEQGGEHKFPIRRRREGTVPAILSGKSRGEGHANIRSEWQLM